MEQCLPVGSSPNCDLYFIFWPITLMLAGGLKAMIVMMVQITRMSLKVKKPKFRIILRNIRSASSLIVLFGVSHLVTFIHDGIYFNLSLNS